MLIFLEVIFSGMYSVNFMQQSNFVLFLKLSSGFDRNILRWSTMAASFPRVTVLIFLEVVSIASPGKCVGS